MKKHYAVAVTELRYGIEYVLAENEDEAKKIIQQHYDSEIDYIHFHSGELIDIEVTEAKQYKTRILQE